ncbi:hypothetical protein [Primorskyibacter sp. S187A]|uniref:hypothetical protein n=1 Tax=Primorskyibacter sp. S187A TaxID=3415130 RepID=UPI003C7AC88F
MTQELFQIASDPETEDIGIFKAPMTDVSVTVTPARARNNRGDVLLKGFVNGTSGMEVLFAGRRRAIAEPLVAHLNRRWAQMRRAAGSDKMDRIETSSVRIPIQVLGCWRTRFETEEDGWRSKIHQLVVAQWSLTTPDGQRVTHGEAPLHLLPDMTPALVQPQRRA